MISQIKKPFTTLTRQLLLGCLIGGSSTLYAAPTVVMETNLGAITIDLYEQKAPATVKNFLKYVDSNFYNGTIFHRVIDGFMVQAGGYSEGLQKKQPLAPIQNESNNGLSNVRGTIAMARTSNPHSATSQFFINTQDNLPLDFRHGRPGYAVFGQVIKGMQVVDKIENSRTGRQGSMADVPLQPIMIKRVYREQ